MSDILVRGISTNKAIVRPTKARTAMKRGSARLVVVLLFVCSHKQNGDFLHGLTVMKRGMHNIYIHIYISAMYIYIINIMNNQINESRNE